MWDVGCGVFSKIFVVSVPPVLSWCSGNVVTCFSDIFLIISLTLISYYCSHQPPCHRSTLSASTFHIFQLKSLKWEFAKKKVRMKKSICLYRDCSLSKNCDNFSSITLTGFTFTLFPPTSRNPRPNCPPPLPPTSQSYLSWHQSWISLSLFCWYSQHRTQTGWWETSNTIFFQLVFLHFG